MKEIITSCDWIGQNNEGKAKGTTQMLGMWRTPSVQEFSTWNKNEVQFPSTQEDETMGQEAGIIPKISVVLE